MSAAPKKSPRNSPGQRLTAALARLPQPEGVDALSQLMDDAGVAAVSQAERASRVARLQGVTEADAKEPAAPAKPYVAPVAPWARAEAEAAARPHFASLLQEAQAESDAQLARRMGGQEEQQPEPQPQPEVLRPDVEVVASLVGMGFEPNCCKRAALATGNADVQAALDWVLANMDSPGVNEPFGDEPAAEPRSVAPAESSDAVLAEGVSDACADDWVDVEPQSEEPTAALPVCPGGWIAVADGEQPPAQPAAGASAAASTASPDAAAAVRKTQEEQDAELAAALQAAQSAQAEEDASLAAALQLEMELEHDREVRQREVQENRRQGGHAQPLDGESRIRVDMSRHYIRRPHYPLACNSNPEPEVLTAEQEAAAAEAPVVEMTWDESTRQFRDERGEIVTKHNSRISGHRNAQKLVDMTDAVGAELGDMSGTSLPNGAYNTLRKHLVGMETRAAKRGGKTGGTDKKDRVNPDGTEYAVEHGGKGNFDGLKIVSAGAAMNWQMQQSWK